MINEIHALILDHHVFTLVTAIIMCTNCKHVFIWFWRLVFIV